MAAPTKIRIKRPAATAPVVDLELEEDIMADEATIEEDVDVDPTVEEGDEDTSPYEELSVEDLRKELTERGLDATGKRSALVARLETDDAAVVKKVAAVQAAAKQSPKQQAAAKAAAAPTKAVAQTKTVTPPKPAPKTAVVQKVAPSVPAKPIPQPEVEEARVDDGDAEEMGQTTLEALMEILRDGEVLILTKSGDGLVLSLGSLPMPFPKNEATKAVVVTGPKLRGDAFWKEVLSPEYYEWYYVDAGAGKPWGTMTPVEKETLVSDLGVEYGPSDDARVNALHQVQALLAYKGIKKYKPEYANPAQRDAIKA